MKRYTLPSIFLLIACLSASAQRAKHPYASDVPITEPKIFAEGVISTQDIDDYFSFTPDGRTIYFTKHSVSFATRTIVVSHFRNGKWTTPQVAPFSGRYRDKEPFISPDGRRLFFSSNRPVDGSTPKNDMDIWHVDRTATGWSEPKNLDAPVNTDAQEMSPSVDREGALYFASTRAGGRGNWDIYRSRLVNGKYGEPENMGEAINSAAADSDSCIDSSGKTFFFASTRAGSWDIYVNYNEDGRWSAARSLSAINTRASERWPALSRDERDFFFTSNRGMVDEPVFKQRLDYRRLVRRLRSAGNDSNDIYRIESSALKLDQR